MVRQTAKMEYELGCAISVSMNWNYNKEQWQCKLSFFSVSGQMPIFCFSAARYGNLVKI